MVNWVLALDIGTKKTGIAVGQSFTGTATYLPVIKKAVDKLSAADFVDIAKEWRVNKILIGFPTLADGKAHPLEKNILRLKEEFINSGFEVVLVPEYLTSYEAKKRFPKLKNFDSVAAGIMIEDYFNSLF